MPICLPPEDSFIDTDRKAISVGLGLLKEWGNNYESSWQDCVTDANGPEIFQQCAHSWVLPEDQDRDEYGEYLNKFGNGRCSKIPPPSKMDRLCKNYHNRLNSVTNFQHNNI